MFLYLHTSFQYEWATRSGLDQSVMCDRLYLRILIVFTVGFPPNRICDMAASFESSQSMIRLTKEAFGMQPARHRGSQDH